MEGVEYFKIERDIKGEYLTTEVELDGSRTKVVIRLQPFISTEFSTLTRWFIRWSVFDLIIGLILSRTDLDYYILERLLNPDNQ